MSNSVKWYVWDPRKVVDDIECQTERVAEETRVSQERIHGWRFRVRKVFPVSLSDGSISQEETESDGLSTKARVMILAARIEYIDDEIKSLEKKKEIIKSEISAIEVKSTCPP